jgi:hypothetical protein
MKRNQGVVAEAEGSKDDENQAQLNPEDASHSAAH